MSLLSEEYVHCSYFPQPSYKKLWLEVLLWLILTSLQLTVWSVQLPCLSPLCERVQTPCRAGMLPWDWPRSKNLLWVMLPCQLVLRMVHR